MAIKFKEAFNLYFLNIEQLRGIGEHLKLGLEKHNSFFSTVEESQGGLDQIFEHFFMFLKILLKF